jgi:Zn-dependent protease/CBS domain-containing protein
MFRTTIPLGRLAGVTVGAHWSVVIVGALISTLLASSVLPSEVPGYAPGWYWTTAILTALCFLGSLLAHELAHAVLARRFGMKVKRITLWLLGGAAELEGETPSAKADLTIAAVGPAASLVLGGASLGVAYFAGAMLSPLATTGLLWLGFTNVVLAVFNLLPGAPLDGGRVLRAAVWMRTGNRSRAATVAAKAGMALGFALTMLGLGEALFFGRLSGLWLALIGWFLLGASQTEFAGEVAKKRLGDLRVRAIMDTGAIAAPGWWTVESFLDRVAGQARRRVFPVVSFEGAPLGVVSLGELVRMAPQDRLTTRVCDAGRPATQVATGNDRVADLLTKASLREGMDLLLVVDDGRLAGVINAGDIARTLELTALGVPGPAV